MMRQTIFEKFQGIFSDLVWETQDKSGNINIENHWCHWNVGDGQISWIMTL